MSITQYTPAALANCGPPPGQSRRFYDPVPRLGISWLEPALEADRTPLNTMALTEAVAAIVAIAAARARDAGDFAALRNAVDRALASAPAHAEACQDPREARAPDPPMIQDMAPGEADGLRALMRRQASR